LVCLSFRLSLRYGKIHAGMVIPVNGDEVWPAQLMVLTLKIQNGNTSGSLRRPEHFQMTESVFHALSSAKDAATDCERVGEAGETSFCRAESFDKK